MGSPDENVRDQLTILAGTGQNIAGLVVFVAATFGMGLMVARGIGTPGAFAQVTLVTQMAFVAGAATRFGMDMAAVRRVAIEVGAGEPGRSRSIVRIAVRIAAVVSLVVAAIWFLFSSSLAALVNSTTPAMRTAALALIFVALAQVYLGGSRGLKIMRHTLYAYWIGQSISWIAITLILWSMIGRTVAVTTLAYALSWVVATLIALFSWRSATSGFTRKPAEPDETRRLVRYGAPRAPAALLSQAIFYTDLFILVHLAPGAGADAYAAAIRVAQALVLFLTAISYMFSPFVADLYARGERDRLNALYKQITRWTLAGTIPLLLLFAIAPGPVLHAFGAHYAAGSAWLRVLLIGQSFNVSVGAAGFVLIMVGRTGWDLAVYSVTFVLDLVVAILLVPHLGPMGAAIAQASALTVSNTLRLYLVWHFVRIQPYDRQYARLAIPAAACAAMMLAVTHWLSSPKWGIELLATALLGGTVYLVVLVAAGLTEGERVSVVRFVRKVV